MPRRDGIALTLEELIDISCNQTKLIVGRVQFVEVPDGSLPADGRLDISKSLASAALDTSPLTPRRPSSALKTTSTRSGIGARRDYASLSLFN